MDIKSIGTYLMGIGALAIILNFANMVPRVMMWIYAWGEGVAWSIKIGVLILGAVLYLIGYMRSKETQS